MEIKNDIKTYSISWLAGSYDTDESIGVISNYYIPENLEELHKLCLSLLGQPFSVVGHTSNIYFRPKTCLQNVISTRKLKRWSLDGDILTCECGVDVKSLAKEMVSMGIEGFSGLVDLPGTVGAAIYGNASVSKWSISSLLESVTILMKSGEIKEFISDEMHFGRRTSALKENRICGVILSCKLRAIKGDDIQIKKDAEYVHNWRLNNQPSPSRNLGTTILLDTGIETIRGKIIRGVAKIFSVFSTDKQKTKTSITMTLLGHKEIASYMEGLNRFMWRDSKAHTVFDQYVSAVRKLYRNARLEIEIW